MRYEHDAIPQDALDTIRPAFAHALMDEAPYWVDQCREGLAQYWRSADGAYSAITQVRDTDKGRVFHMVASCGSFREELLREGEEWARTMGCTKSITEGRPGWARVLPGYKVTHCTYSKEF